MGIATQLCERWWIDLPHRDLAYLPEGTDEFWVYVRELRWAQHYAALNRDEMINRLVECLASFLDTEVEEHERVNYHHNYTDGGSAMTPTNPDVSGWRPDFRSGHEQFTRQSARLRALIGRRIVQTYTVWFADADWFADMPVVLRFDRGPQLEVCWEKLDEVSLTWDTIDVGVGPRGWVSLPLEWRRDANPALRAVVGGVVTDVHATTFHLVTRSLTEPGECGKWVVGGLRLTTDRGQLHIFNALDENGLESEPSSRNRSIPV